MSNQPKKDRTSREQFGYPGDSERRWYTTLTGDLTRSEFLKGRLTELGHIHVEEIEGVDPKHRIRLRLDRTSVIIDFGCDDLVDYIGTENGNPHEILERIEYLFGYKIYESSDWHFLMIHLCNGGFFDEDGQETQKAG